MEGWYSTGTALAHLLKRISPSSGSINGNISNLQYPSKWKVRTEVNAYRLSEELPLLQPVDISLDPYRRNLGRRDYVNDKARVNRLLHRLKEINSSISAFFHPRFDTEEGFRLRLLSLSNYHDLQNSNSKDDTEETADSECRIGTASYIALSYCWHYPSWDLSPGLRISSDRGSPLPSIPVTSPMWSAFLAERQSPKEAIWVDQGCIDQSSHVAKMYAINSMDIIFGGARKVVIALEDVLLSPEEAEVLIQYCHAIQSLSGRERLLIWADWLTLLDDKAKIAMACLKIFRARWFRRAWCSHEFLTARSHTFLVPILGKKGCKSTGDSVTILSFNTDFLLAVLLARTDWILSEDRTDLANVIRHHLAPAFGNKDAADAMDRSRRQDTVMVGFAQGLVKAMLDREKSQSGKPYLAAFGDVLSLDSSSAVDKLAITLNILNTGLSYQGPQDLTETDVSLMAATVALAANDASALAARGPFLDMGNLTLGIMRPDSYTWSKESDRADPIGWATRPQVDTYSRLGLQRIETPVFATLINRGLQIPLSFIANSKALRAPNSDNLKMARRLLTWYSVKAGQFGHPKQHSDVEDTILADFRAFSLEKDQAHQVVTGVHQPQLTQVLACLLELGGWWVASYGTNLRPDFHGSTVDEVSNKIRHVQRALSWIKHSTSQLEFLNLRYSVSDELWVDIKRLFRYASEIVRTGAGERSESVKEQVPKDFSFQICKIHDSATGSSSETETLTYAPCRISSPYELAIPLSLTAEDFPVDINRVWILTQRAANKIDSNLECQEYTLKGKTRFVGCIVPDGQVRRVIVGG